MTENLENKLVQHKKFVPWIITIALFMETLDMTILNNAVPAIAQHLNEHPLNLKLALTSYLISLGILIPISGALADKFGSKEILTFGVLLFGLGSCLCGISDSLYGLVLARILQGAGGALMMPVCRLILLKSYAKSEIVGITNYATLPSLLGPALGPVIGGIIVTYFSWRWIFFINIPFCFILLYMIYSFTITLKEEDNNKLDIQGFIFCSLGLSVAIFTLEAASESFFTITTYYILIFVSVIFIILYLYFSSNKSNPFINPKLFKSRTFTVTVMGSFFSRLGIGGIPFLIPLLLQINHNFSPLKSGFYVVFYAFAMICAKFFVKKILRMIGFRNALIINTTLIGITIAGFSVIVNIITPAVIIMMIFLNGFFTSIQFSCMNVLSYIDLEEEIMSNGTSIGSALQQLSMGFGITFLAFLLKIQDPNNNLIDHNAYNFTIYSLSLCLLFSSFIFLMLDKNAGSKASGYVYKR